MIIGQGGEGADVLSDLLLSMKTVENVVNAALYGFQTLVGDCFMVSILSQLLASRIARMIPRTCQIYRMYMVWNGNKVICVPATVTLVASTGRTAIFP